MPDSNPGPLPYKSGALPMSQQAQHISDITLGRESQPQIEEFGCANINISKCCLVFFIVHMTLKDLE